MKFKSLKTQVLVWFSVISIIILFIFNGAFYYFLEENIKLSIQNKLYDKAVFINDSIVAGIPVEQLLKNKALESFDISIVKEDKIIFKKGTTPFKALMPLIKDKKSFFVFAEDDNLNGLYIFKIYKPFKGAILFYARGINKEINTKIQEVKKTFFILEPALLLLLIFAANKLITKILKPIVKITQTANKISVTDLSQTIEQPLDDDEIKELVDSFNNMISRLQGEVQHIEQFNSDVSHELKTPLTVIKGEVEITLNKSRDEDYYIKSLNTVNYEANQIQTIVDSLLMLTKYTKANIQQTFKLINLDKILEETISQYTMTLNEKNIKLNITTIEAIEFNANAQLISIVFSNLIDNAIKYSSNNTSICVSLYKKEDNIIFSIQDEGIGIPQDQLTKVSNRFYRVDESRNKKIKGFGLGLSLVQNSLDLHNGTISITSTENIGTNIEIVL